MDGLPVEQADTDSKEILVDMADMLLGDINNAITELEKLEYTTPTRMDQEKNLPVEAKMFNHGGRRKTAKK